jgi:hypothetical protein
MMTNVAEPVKARLRADSVVEVDEATLGSERKTALRLGARCA